MTNPQSLLHLDNLSKDSILSLLAEAKNIKNSENDVSSSMVNKILHSNFFARKFKDIHKLDKQFRPHVRNRFISTAIKYEIWL